VSRHADEQREIIYLERESPSIVRPLLVGLALGLGVGLLFAPQSGEDTRRALRRRLRRLRAFAGDQVDQLSERLHEGVDQIRTGEWPADDEEDEDADEDSATAEAPPISSAREELERRLAAARARRRRAASGDEEPVA